MSNSLSLSVSRFLSLFLVLSLFFFFYLKGEVGKFFFLTGRKRKVWESLPSPPAPPPTHTPHTNRNDSLAIKEGQRLDFMPGFPSREDSPLKIRLYLAGRERDETMGERGALKEGEGNLGVKKKREKVQGWGAGGVEDRRGAVTAPPSNISSRK